MTNNYLNGELDEVVEKLEQDIGKYGFNFEVINDDEGEIRITASNGQQRNLYV